VFNALVMGPWEHGGWGRTRGERLGDIEFGAATSLYYQRDIEFPFFQHYLKGKVDRGGKAAAPGFLAEATVFETGRNQWRQFPSWPPPGVAPMSLFFEADGQLVAAAPTRANASDAFVSDPARPVPSSAAIVTGMTKEYMTEDQRFAARRPDVLVYAGPPLEADVTVAGPLVADLWVSTSQTDADWVVKLIDVLPDDTPTPEGHRGPPLGGYQMMVRSEVLRGRYRDGYDAPRPFSPNRPTRVRIPLQDVLHTFRAGHRIMIQIQSSWFPMVDRNPQRYVPNIFKARARDFVSATHRVHRSRAHPSRIELQRLPSPG
ncbi:MAG: CocE/NonD family hydrolase, partial [Myxococcales bacterium]|nr:CocE/NonD family hydrolase [Myxococcales bacterium]